jgi:hypothetical protein
MELRLYDTLTGRSGRSRRSIPQRAHVCLRADGLRLRPYRQRAAGHRVRRAVPAAAPSLRRRSRHLCPQHHRRRRQDQRARRARFSRPAAERGDPQGHREDNKQFQDDVAALGCLPPTVEPRATEHIAEMRRSSSGWSLGATPMSPRTTCCSRRRRSMPDYGYGALSNRSLDEMIAGARVDVAPYKRDPPTSCCGSRRSPASRHGRRRRHRTPGRPGWHIECSAMAWKHLGESSTSMAAASIWCFRITRTNSRSRCCAFTRPMANVWMHNGFLQVEGEKMSKSSATSSPSGSCWPTGRAKCCA